MAEKFGEKKEKSAAEMRKINKPLMERKRRERINNCLNQLKMFLMETTKKDSSYYSKLEKADILELTVKYLKTLQRQQLAAAMVTDPKLASKYTAGYSQCANEVTRYLNKLDGFSPDLRGRLLGHITSCLQTVESTTPAAQNQSHLPSSSRSQGHLSQGQSLLSLALPSSSSSASHTQSRPDSPDTDTALALSSANTIPTVTFPGTSGTISLNINNQLQQVQLQQPFMTTQQQQQQPQPQQQNVPVLPVQLIPAKLPSGDMVFLMTNTQSVPTMATNLMTTPVSIQIPGTSPSSSTSSGSAPGLTLGSGSSFGLTVTSSVATGVTSTPTSVAIVQPNVHECEASPSNMPTDLSMKSVSEPKQTQTNSRQPLFPVVPLSSSSPSSKQPLSLSPSSPSSVSLSAFPSLPLNLQTHGKSLLSPPVPAKASVKPESTSSSSSSRSNVPAAAASSTSGETGDVNNNNVRASVSRTIHEEAPGNLATREQRHSPVPGPVFPGPAPFAHAHAAAGHRQLFVDPNQPGPSGLGPMWRPW